MRQRRIPPVSIALLLFSSFGRGADSPLLGKWESLRNPNGLGTVLEFRADGTLRASFGAIVDMTYRVENGVLISSYIDERTRKSQEVRIPITISADTLIERSPDGSRPDVSMKREKGGRQGDPPIVGTWSSAQKRGTAYTTFTSDGRQMFRYPIRVSYGKWSASDGKLTLVDEGRPSETSSYAIEGDVLSLPDATGPPAKYRRARP
jgi:hypothetical protein